MIGGIRLPLNRARCRSANLPDLQAAPAHMPPLSLSDFCYKAWALAPPLASIADLLDADDR
jgi:hypothetical protein